jgi:hypothetical protein
VWFLIFGFLGFSAFEAARGEWATAAAALVAVGLFWALARQIDRHRSIWGTDGDAEARRRQLSIRALPFFIVIFAVMAIHDLVENDWLGALFAAGCLGGVSVGLWTKRRQLRGQ